MNTDFSFLVSKHEQVHRIVSDLFPQIREYSYLTFSDGQYFLHENGKSYSWEERKKFGNFGFEAEAESEQESTYDWVSPAFAGFSEDKPDHSQDLFNEINNTVLYIRSAKGRNDDFLLCFFRFPRHASMIGLTHENKPLSTDQKQLIALTISRSIQSLLVRIDNDTRALRYHNNAAKKVVNASTKSRKNIEKQFSLKESRLKDYFNHLLSLHESRLSKRLMYSQEAIEKLKSYTGPIEMYAEIVKEAVYIASSLHALSNQSMMVIESDYIDLHTGKSQEDKGKKIYYPSYYDRLYEYLDELELAAVKCSQKNLKITGRNIAENLPRYKTPSSVTIYIKKYRDKIADIMKSKPDKWPLIRQDFSTIRNIIENDSGRERFSNAI